MTQRWLRLLARCARFGLPWAALALLICAPAVQAEDKVRVGVVFELKQRDFKRGFTAAEVTELEALVAKDAAQALNESVGFLKFVADATAPNVLRIRLDDVGGTWTQAPHETGFYLEAQAATGATSKPLYWLFRPENRLADAVHGVTVFAREIGAVLKARSAQAGLAPSLFGHVSVSAASFRKKPFGWALPHTRRELCAGPQTAVRVESQLPLDDGLVSMREFRGRLSGELDGHLFTEPVSAQDGLDLLRKVEAERVKMGGLYITEYVPLAVCGATAPEDTRFD